MVGKKIPLETFMVTGKIIPQFIEIVASYATISSWYGRGEGNTAKATTRRSSNRGFRDVSSSFLEFRAVYQWFSILQARSLGRWNIVIR